MNQSILTAANTVRSLTMDAVEKAKSGHPGLPMGCAELGVLLYGEILKHDPKDPRWIDRDRFVLSAGHGSMLLYSLLHLSGYQVSMEDVMSFRQLGSRTPGHPEWGVTPGVENTGGPLGQGIGNGVGMAIAERILAAKFNTPTRTIIDHYTYVLSSDGDMMEGVASEAASLAGHLGLGKLIMFYDSNKITIEGSTDLAFSEDVAARYQAYGWHTQSGSMYDVDGIATMIAAAKAVKDKPSLILLKSVIGKGAPNKAGTSKVHGEALGPDEVKAAKAALGIPEGSQFYVFPGTREYFAEKAPGWASRHEQWEKSFSAWEKENPGLAAELTTWMSGPVPLPEAPLASFKEGESLATRAASGKVLNVLAAAAANLFGGSADLAPSNSTNLKDMGDFNRTNPMGRNFHFGIREHGMGAIVNGMAYHGGLRPFCATFMVFSDYMRGAVRIAAIAKLPVIYIFTHDSIFVGEDGPTHEPVEHMAALRAIPNLMVLRPADAEETEAAWRTAYQRKDGPTVLALTRQGLPVFPKADPEWRQTVRKGGAYVVKDCQGAPDIVIVATGSEVNVAVQAAAKLTDKKVRVVSMMCRELFASQDAAFKKKLIPPKAKKVVFEAGVSFGWKSPWDEDTLTVSIDRFGESGAYQKLAEHFGVTADALVKRIEEGK